MAQTKEQLILSIESAEPKAEDDQEELHGASKRTGQEGLLFPVENYPLPLYVTACNGFWFLIFLATNLSRYIPSSLVSLQGTNSSVFWVCVSYSLGLGQWKNIFDRMRTKKGPAGPPAWLLCLGESAGVIIEVNGIASSEKVWITWKRSFCLLANKNYLFIL